MSEPQELGVIATIGATAFTFLSSLGFMHIKADKESKKEIHVRLNKQEIKLEATQVHQEHLQSAVEEIKTDVKSILTEVRKC